MPDGGFLCSAGTGSKMKTGPYEELRDLFNMKMTVVPIIVGALGSNVKTQWVQMYPILTSLTDFDKRGKASFNTVFLLNLLPILDKRTQSVQVFSYCREGRTDGFMPFSNETQTASTRIWTRIANSISYDDNRYANKASATFIWTFTLKKNS